MERYNQGYILRVFLTKLIEATDPWKESDKTNTAMRYEIGVPWGCDYSSKADWQDLDSRARASFIKSRFLCTTQNLEALSKNRKARLVFQGHADAGKSIIIYDSEKFEHWSLWIILIYAVLKA